MAITIKSSATSDEMVVDPISKSARITTYNSSGDEIFPRPTGVYGLAFNMGRLSAVAVTDDCIWSMYNSGTKTVRILGIILNK